MDVRDDRASTPRGKGRRRVAPTWHADSVRALRRHLGLTQRAIAEELGTRQQTVSEWETSLHRPRGASARLLTLIAERAGFVYGTEDPKQETREAEQQGDSRS